MSGKWHGVPKPVLAVGGGVVVVLLYKWYKNRQTAAAATTSATPPAGIDPLTGMAYQAGVGSLAPGASSGSGSGSGGGYGGGWGGGYGNAAGSATTTTPATTSTPGAVTTPAPVATTTANGAVVTPPDAVQSAMQNLSGDALSTWLNGPQNLNGPYYQLGGAGYGNGVVTNPNPPVAAAPGYTAGPGNIGAVPNAPPAVPLPVAAAPTTQSQKTAPTGLPATTTANGAGQVVSQYNNPATGGFGTVAVPRKTFGL